LAIDVGQTLLPAIGAGADAVAAIATALSDLPAPVQAAVTGIGGLATAASLAAGGFLLAAPRILQTKQALDTLAATMPRTVGLVRDLGGLLRGPLGIGLGVAAAGLMVYGDHVQTTQAITAEARGE